MKIEFSTRPLTIGEFYLLKKTHEAGVDSVDGFSHLLGLIQARAKPGTLTTENLAELEIHHLGPLTEQLRISIEESARIQMALDTLNRMFDSAD